MDSFIKKALVALIAVSGFVLFSSLTVNSPSYVFTKADLAGSVSLYETIDFDKAEAPDHSLFEHVMVALEEINHENLNKSIITIIDFTKPSTEKRLWTIDIDQKKLLYHTWVAHGQNSGYLYADKFSNRHGSHQSSLGFYITGNTYVGKHGLSLKLHGIEEGVNDQAESRAIVMHGADYVSEEFIKRNGRLGRSHGCPAIPMDLHKQLISDLADGSLLFIYYPDENYISTSSFAKKNLESL